MLIAVIGEHCAGKSTLAEKLRQEFGARVVSGRDYLRLAKSESEAEGLFRKQLRDAVSGENLIYVIAEPGQIQLLPDGAVRILVTADLETIRERFRARLHGNLPAPVAQMLERNHGMFDTLPCAYRFDGVCGDADALCRALRGDTDA